jgi:DNA-binding transcriptional LysR family regulator
MINHGASDNPRLNVMVPDPRQLRYFLAVVEAGSLSRAAAMLNLSEPALSKSIRLLEQSLGVQLLERHARGITPTVFGQALTERARVIRSELRHAYEDISMLRGGERGQVTVGTLPLFAAGVLPRAVAELLTLRPGIQVSVREALADSLIPKVLSGDFDFALMTMRPYEIDPALAQEFLQKRDLPVVIMGSGHPLSTRDALGLDELGDLKWILPPKSDGLRLDFDRLFEAARLPPPEPVVESNSVLFIRSVLREVQCVTYLSPQLVRQELDQDILTSADIRTDRHQADIAFVYRRHGMLSPAARILMDRLRAICQGAPQRTLPARVRATA